MMYVDIMSRLPGQSLMILDRATMAYSLESRSPFLDPRFWRNSWPGCPSSLKIHGRQPPLLERRLGERYLPPEVLRRKKQGFASPLMYILDDEVRAPGASAAAPERAGSRRVSPGRADAGAGEEHLARRRDHGNRIWLLLTAEVWYRRYISGRSTADLEMELADGSGEPPARTRSGA